MLENLVTHILKDEQSVDLDIKYAEASHQNLKLIAKCINKLELVYEKNEGFDKAEVTLGGVSTSDLKNKSMESKLVKNLYFIGEIVDVTGFLGGYNFQWAWSSAYIAARDIAILKENPNDK